MHLPVTKHGFYEPFPQSQRDRQPSNINADEYHRQPSGQGREKLSHVATLPPGMVRLPTAEQEVKSLPHLTQK